jgi:sugar phosphate isomerase/epimerase
MRLGVQLYTLRDLMDADLPGTLAKVAGIGYRFVETAGLHGRSPGEYRLELDRARLTAVACHVGLPEVEGGLADSISMAATLGAHWLVVPWVPQGAYSGGWDAFGKRLGRVAENVIKSGLRFAYHNHAFEFELEDGTTGYERLWASAPETVEAELDVYWADHAGNDPADWLRRLAGRVPLAHFKDGKDGRFTAVGEGTLDWGEIVKAANTAGVEYAIVELDECPRDGIDCVADSFKFLRGVGVGP